MFPLSETRVSRRRCIQTLAALSSAGLIGSWPAFGRPKPRKREYNVCLSPEIILSDPEFPARLRDAGVSCVWLAGFFYGYWPWPMEYLVSARELLLKAGLECRVVNVPLGHPGDSLGSRDQAFPLTPPLHWRTACTPDGKRYAGTSLHVPATQENVNALRGFRRAGFAGFLLDDDFRLARSPGEIGGCFCDAHRDQFLRLSGLPAERWPEVLDDVRSRRSTNLLHLWLEFICDELTGSFRAQQQAAGRTLGIMVMYLGAEKAGIRLKDYCHVPFRVGESMFDDGGFGPLKGKTDELFSVLFHRRFTAPELAYSETTAYPADRLSADHLAAKLVISTIADVRHTMFMSGVSPFPKQHWETLKPAMQSQADSHEHVADHKLSGPLKHYWGEASRFTGNDQPFSLFLAMGIPFEVTDKPARDGWTFLSDADAAAAAAGKLRSRGTIFVSRRLPARDSSVQCEESLGGLFPFKRSIVPALKRIPHVENDVPAILAWYPSAKAALLWNPTRSASHFKIRFGTREREVSLGSLESTVLLELSS